MREDFLYEINFLQLGSVLKEKWKLFASFPTLSVIDSCPTLKTMYCESIKSLRMRD